MNPVRQSRPAPPAGEPPRHGQPGLGRMAPSLVTVIGLCAGLTGMRFALEGRFEAAVLAVMLAAVIDGMDGRLARLLGATSRFGVEIDSLADLVCFGVVPAVVLYAWSLRTAGGLGFLPCTLFAVCMALRLARFNAAFDAAPRAPHARDFFTGVPAPAGAGLALFPVFAGLAAERHGWEGVLAASRSVPLCAAVLTGTALLLVSTLPVWNFKKVRLGKPPSPVLLGAAAVWLALLLASPWIGLACTAILYLAMLPFSLGAYRRLERQARSAGQDWRDPQPVPQAAIPSDPAA